MATVVVIHAAEDTLPARALAEKLRQAKLEVVLEKQPGDDLRSAVKAAPVTIALWSPRSIEQAPIAEEVAFARSKSKLIHANMQSAGTPQQFSGDQSVNLTGWRGEDDFPAWRELAQLVTSKAGVPPLPPPAPRQPSGFFQPGRVDADAPAQAAPQQRAPQQAAPRQQAPQQARPAAQAPRSASQAPPQSRPTPAPRPTSSAPPEPEQKKGGGMVIALVAVIAVAVLGGGGYFFWSQQQGAQASATAWEEVEQNDAASIRAFLEGNPGDMRDEAEAALAALDDRTYEAASDADTIEALQAFVDEFPNSEHAIAARGRIAELQTMPQTPVEGEVPVEGAPIEAAPDPDLAPPSATTPDTGAGPAPLTPPPEEDPAAPVVEPGAPTN